jgi:hypothetical protein
MKRWIVLILVAAFIVLAAITTPLWLPFVSTNANTIKGLQSLVPLILWIVAGSVVLFGYLHGRTRSGETASAPTARINTGGGLSVGSNARADQGSKIVGRDDQSINLEADVVIASDRMLREFRRAPSSIDLKRVRG